jgi:hypothetical protein
MAAAAAHGGTYGLDPWLATLRTALAAEPVPDSLDAALAPLATVVDVPALLRAANLRLQAPPGSWPPDDWRHMRPDFPGKFASAFHVFTLQDPNLYGPLGAACHAVDRQAGPSGISAQLRAFMPYMKLLEAGMEEAALFWGYFIGKTTRGVKYAFPEPSVATHDPEAHFPPGREVHWFEFNSSSTRFDVMYRPWFCGEAGPRTIFEITSCEGIDIKKFSHLPDEDEVLFGLGAHFRVISSSKRLRPENLAPNAPKGGFPDEVRLEQLPRDPAQQLQMVSVRLREEMRAKALADRERDEAVAQLQAVQVSVATERQQAAQRLEVAQRELARATQAAKDELLEERRKNAEMRHKLEENYQNKLHELKTEHAEAMAQVASLQTARDAAANPLKQRAAELELQLASLRRGAQVAEGVPMSETEKQLLQSEGLAKYIPVMQAHQWELEQVKDEGKFFAACGIIDPADRATFRRIFNDLGVGSRWQVVGAAAAAAVPQMCAHCHVKEAQTPHRYCSRSCEQRVAELELQLASLGRGAQVAEGVPMSETEKQLLQSEGLAKYIPVMQAHQWELEQVKDEGKFFAACGIIDPADRAAFRRIFNDLGVGSRWQVVVCAHPQMCAHCHAKEAQTPHRYCSRSCGSAAATAATAAGTLAHRHGYAASFPRQRDHSAPLRHQHSNSGASNADAQLPPWI